MMLSSRIVSMVIVKHYSFMTFYEQLDSPAKKFMVIIVIIIFHSFMYCIFGDLFSFSRYFLCSMMFHCSNNFLCALMSSLTSIRICLIIGSRRVAQILQRTDRQRRKRRLRTHFKRGGICYIMLYSSF